MTLISYAQNFEDVMLRRALGGVANGFYVDVGAQDPADDSVTKAFYDAGWRGINIEPVRVWHDRLVAARPLDINLNVAVSDHSGDACIYEVADTGLSTVVRSVAEQHRLDGYEINEQFVSCTTLDAICDQYEVSEIHFLKLDCEGAEAATLRGFSLEARRPWIIVVESMSPNSQVPAFAEWESLVTQRGYHLVYEDGLNRYYVADERAALDRHFQHPPNVFDAFMRASEHRVRIELERRRADLDAAVRAVDSMGAELEARAREIEVRDHRLQEVGEVSRRQEEAIQRFQASLRIAQNSERETRLTNEYLKRVVSQKDLEASRVRVANQMLEQHLDALFQSTSWRITRPLRAVRMFLSESGSAGRSLLWRGFVASARTLRPVIRWVFQWKWVVGLVRARLRPASAFGARLQQFVGYDLGFRSDDQETDEVELSWQANRALREIDELCAGRVRVEKEAGSLAIRT